ncbi:aldo/keto reductase [Streptomyces sp. NPDC050516]|uniref:aldo/keto reductase n=1 Tax=Streptomyces sp. NPDC050516 TaxID=3365621 RepID=UPI0037AE3089
MINTDELAADDIRRGQPRFQGDNLAANLHLVQQVRALAANIGCTPAQLALAWVLAQGNSVIPIPGMRSRTHLNENVGALAVKLTEEQLRSITTAVPEASGARAPDLSRLEK